MQPISACEHSLAPTTKQGFGSKVGEEWSRILDRVLDRNYCAHQSTQQISQSVSNTAERRMYKLVLETGVSGSADEHLTRLVLKCPLVRKKSASRTKRELFSITWALTVFQCNNRNLGILCHTTKGRKRDPVPAVALKDSAPFGPTAHFSSYTDMFQNEEKLVKSFVDQNPNHSNSNQKYRVVRVG